MGYSTNYSFVKPIDPGLYDLCVQFEAKIKTYPTEAMRAANEIFEYFIACVCGDNDISFDRPKYTTPVIMLGKCFEYGAITVGEKALLDEIRYGAFQIREEGVTCRSSQMLEYDKRLFEMLKRYYNEEVAEFDTSRLPIGVIQPVEPLLPLDFGCAYDQIYLCEEPVDKSTATCVVAQFSKGASPAADEVFAQAALLPKLLARAGKCKSLISYTLLDTETDNDMLLVYAPLYGDCKPFRSLPEGLTNRQLIKLAQTLLSCLEELHKLKPAIGLGGFDEGALFLQREKKNLSLVLGGFDVALGRAPFIAGAGEADFIAAKQEDMRATVAFLKKYVPFCREFSREFTATVLQIEDGDAVSIKDFRKIFDAAAKKWCKLHKRKADALAAFDFVDMEEVPAEESVTL